MSPETHGGFYSMLTQALNGHDEIPVAPEAGRSVIRIVEIAIASSEMGMALPVEEDIWR